MSDDEETTATVEQRLEELAAEVHDERSRHLRLAADFENFRRRSRQERLDTERYGSATVVERLLPVLDDLERAVERVPAGTDERWLRGLRLVLDKLRETLATSGVEPIEALGRPFDPRLHEAIAHEETESQPEGTVVAQLRRGYRLHDRVLRPSLVKIARRPAAPDGQAEARAAEAEADEKEG
jgi:molecular chaperone GrpE